MDIINMHDAKTHLSKLIERAMRGEEIIVAKAGKPMAKIVPLNGNDRFRRQPGGLHLSRSLPLSVFTDPLPDEELLAWED